MNTTTLAPTTDIHDEALMAPATTGAAEQAHGAGSVTERGPEIAVAALLMALGGLVVFDSVRLGAGWADDGPQSGYFPFFIGLMLLGSSAVVFLRAVLPLLASGGKPAESPVFVEREQLSLVMAMLVPACLYVAAMSVLGLYVTSIALIGWFMRRHGGFGWMSSAAVSLGVPLTFFLVFERWFLVPLPKGPLEQLLGF